MSKRNVISIREARRAREAASAPVTEIQRAAELRAMTLGDVIETFHHLEVPSVAEMDGEYVATLLDHGGTAINVIAFLATNVPRRWLGKAFHPCDDETGRGYNWFQGRRRAVRRYRMKTYVAASAVDAKQSYVLEYRPFNGGLMRGMVDEVRRVAPGLYLGLGRISLGRFARMRLYPFLLEGPVGPYSDPGMG
jgi:hypothetical protein